MKLTSSQYEYQSCPLSPFILSHSAANVYCWSITAPLGTSDQVNFLSEFLQLTWLSCLVKIMMWIFLWDGCRSTSMFVPFGTAIASWHLLCTCKSVLWARPSFLWPALAVGLLLSDQASCSWAPLLLPNWWVIVFFLWTFGILIFLGFLQSEGNIFLVSSA